MNLLPYHLLQSKELKAEKEDEWFGPYEGNGGIRQEEEEVLSSFGEAQGQRAWGFLMRESKSGFLQIIVIKYYCWYWEF